MYSLGVSGLCSADITVYVLFPLFDGSSITASGTYDVKRVAGTIDDPKLHTNAVESPTFADIIIEPFKITTTDTVVPPCTQFHEEFGLHRFTINPPGSTLHST